MPSMKTRKAVRDLVGEKYRALLAIAAIAVGVVAAGASLSSYSILTRELAAGYLATNPATAGLLTSEIPADLFAELRALPVLRYAETRDRIDARARVGEDEWKNLWIYVVEDFDDMRIANIKPQEGAWPPADGEILLERQSFRVAPLPFGTKIAVRRSNGMEATLDLVGSVHDMGTAPAWMENLLYGYVTRATAGVLGAGADQRELKIISAGDSADREHNRAVATSVASWLAARGVTVLRIEVPVPERHVHADQMDSLLLLLGGFGVLSLALACLLIVTLMSSLLARHVREIAVMKAVGASVPSIRGVYVRMVLILGGAALLIGSPLGLLVGRTYAYLAARQLNFTIVDDSVSGAVFLLEAAVAVLLTLAVAAFPITRGTSTSIREALSNYGTRELATRAGLSSRLLSVLFAGDRPMLIAVRNVFRRRGRFVRSLLMLAAGGAVFMTGMNLRSSLAATTRTYFDGLLYDIGVTLGRPYPLEEVSAALDTVPGLRGFDYGMQSQAQVVSSDGSLSTGVRFSSIPLPSTALALPLVSGRWLSPDDKGTAVVNARLLEAAPGLRVGDELRLDAGGSRSTWTIVGVVSEATVPGLYVPYGTLPPPARGTANCLRIDLEQRGSLAEAGAKKLIEAAFSRAGIGIASQISMAETRKIIDEHLVVITVFLTSMSVFTIVVGFLGLASALSLSVLERRREIGVMRATGAAPRRVMALIMSEGLVTAALSWVLGVALSLPLSLVMGRMLGTMLLSVPLDLVVNPAGLGIWFGSAALIGAASGFFPALSAARASLREVLAYE